MNDDKDIREPKVASRTHPLELPFTFTVPRQLLPTICPSSNLEEKERHLQLPPSMGCWNHADDMSPDMYLSRATNVVLMSRSKIEYEVRVQVQSTVDGKSKNVAESIEPVQIMPLYQWWQSLRSRPAASPSYEQVVSPSTTPSEHGQPTTVEVEKTLKKGFLGKKKGRVTVSMEVPDSYYINVGQSDNTVNPLSMPIKMRYSPITADLPPNVSSLSARLHARTKYNVDRGIEPRNAGIYNTSITLLKAATPSTSTPLWLEESTTNKLSFVANLLIPMNLPPAAGSSSSKGQKVLLPSFDSCLISRSYELEVRIGFEGGSETVLRLPTSIIAKPATSAAETALEEAVRIADNWTPPGHETVAADVEPDLLRPTLRTLNLNDPESNETSDTEDSNTNVRAFNTSPLPDQIADVPSDSPPDYDFVVTTVSDKIVDGHCVIAVAARTA